MYICCRLTKHIYIRKTELAIFCLISANGKRKFVFLGQQTINGNRCLPAKEPIYACHSCPFTAVLSQLSFPSCPVLSVMLWPS